MARARIIWSPEAQAALREIGRRIAREASPRTARAFTNRVRAAAGRLRLFPESGAWLDEVRDPTVREVYCKNYRIIYRFTGSTVYVLTVQHAARSFDEGTLEL